MSIAVDVDLHKQLKEDATRNGLKLGFVFAESVRSFLRSKSEPEKAA